MNTIDDCVEVLYDRKDCRRRSWVDVQGGGLVFTGRSYALRSICHLNGYLLAKMFL